MQVLANTRHVHGVQILSNIDGGCAGGKGHILSKSTQY